MSYAIMCGTDDHAKTLVNRIALDREEPETLTVPNTIKGRQRLLKHLKRLSEKHRPERIVLAYEASYCGFLLHDDCVAAGIECFILAPTKLAKSRSQKKKKCDIRDAQYLLEVLRGHVLAGNELPSIWIPDYETRDDRELVRMRLCCGMKLTAVKSQVQALLKRNAIVKPPEAGTPWTLKYCRWLRSLDLAPGAGAALASLLRQLEHLVGEIAILEKEIEALSQTPRYKEPSTALVEKIKGVGLLSAMVYLTEMGDLSRFKNRRKVGSFLGYAPSTFETGNADDRKGHITREGPGRVRWILSQASWARIRWDERESRFYWRIVDRNPKCKKKAAVACARRLGILMWHIGLEAQQKAGVFEVAA
jgi:transposase